MDNIEIGVWQEPACGERECGDGYFFIESNGILNLGVVDALGHGTSAAETKITALAALGDCQGSLEDILKRVHQQLIGTRGAALNICRINTIDSIIEYVGIGSIYSYIITKNDLTRLPIAFGTLGYHWPAFKEWRIDLSGCERLLITSDGIRPINKDQFFKHRLESTGDLARGIGETWGLKHDDRTVLVVNFKKVWGSLWI